MSTLNRFALSIAALVFITACKKDDDESAPTPTPEQPCAAGNFGFITVSNTSTNDYQIRIDNVIVDTVPGNSIVQNIVINQGNGRALYALQLEGFIVFPTEVNATLNVIECSNYSWQIP